jgi:hypothetical protein
MFKISNGRSEIFGGYVQNFQWEDQNIWWIRSKFPMGGPKYLVDTFKISNGRTKIFGGYV